MVGKRQGQDATRLEDALASLKKAHRVGNMLQIVGRQDVVELFPIKARADELSEIGSGTHQIRFFDQVDRSRVYSGILPRAFAQRRQIEDVQRNAVDA